jgi:hypothetical protein
MARSDLAFASARSAYERRHVYFGLRGVVLAAVFVCAAIALHRTTQATWFVAAVLTATLATFGWRGGAWRRGSLAGVLAGLPVFVTPAVYFLVKHGHSCPQCAMTPSLSCMLMCFGTSAVVGAAVGTIATRDESPRRFAMGALAGALFTGMLGCGTTGYGGAAGIAVGLLAGSVTGWVVASRTAHA